jgi:hypothetical protein
MLISENTLLFGDISAFQTKNCRKPVDTPLRETVPRSALTMGVDDLFRAVFFRHVRKAAVPIQDARGRVVEEHDEAGILLHPLNTDSGIPLSKFSNQLNLVL